MELLTLKIMVLLLSGVVRLGFGLFPILLIKKLLKNNRRVKTIIGFLMFFGGGVLLATCFLHMMPHVRESFSTGAPDTNFPLSELVFIAGFFLVYLLEDVVHSIIDRKRRLKKENSSRSSATGSTSISSSKSNTPPRKLQIPKELSLRETKDIFRRNSNEEIPGVDKNNKNSAIRPEYINYNRKDNDLSSAVSGERFSYIDPDWWRDTVIFNGSSQQNLMNNSNFSLANSNSSSLHEIPLANPNGLVITVPAPTETPKIQGKNAQNNAQNISVIPVNVNNNNSPTVSERKSESDSNSIEDSIEEHEHHHHEHNHSHLAIPSSTDGPDDESILSSIRNLLIIIAISFHGVFEGMAIGLQKTELDVWYLFLAVSLHECTILFCIGIELISSKTKIKRMITYILVVSMVSPVGIAIGTIISEETTSHTLVVGVFQGIAAGTLMYVTFLEIFAAEGRKLHAKYMHILVALLGFLLMGGLELIGGHNHNHGSSTGAHSHKHENIYNHTHDDHHHHSGEVHDHDHDHDHDHGHDHSHEHVH